ncbi:MAG: response regulator [Proteobacteria bacterium]|nr:response regulator [Pseudomonadota bacterium]
MPLITILVEDNQTIRDSLIPTLAELGGMKVVATADTAATALAALQEYRNTWQVAVVDLFLREGSGLTVVRACQRRLEFQHVLVLTNYATSEMRKRCLALGADGVFDKSTELEMFFAQCNAYHSK